MGAQGAWWARPRHTRPELPDTLETEAAKLADAARAGLLTMAGAARSAYIHSLWAIGLWAKRVDGAPWVTNTYVKAGASVSDRAARRGLREACHALQATRDTRGVVRLQPEAVAAAYDLASEMIDEGQMHEPAVSVPTTGPSLEVGPFEGVKGRCRCPCDGHSNNDRDPSGLFDLKRGRLTCRATGRVFILTEYWTGWEARRIDYDKMREHHVSGPINKGCPSARECAQAGLDLAGDPGDSPTILHGLRTGRLYCPDGGSTYLKDRWEDLDWTEAMLRYQRRVDRDPDGAWRRSACDGYPDLLVGLEVPRPGQRWMGTSRVLFDLDDLEWKPADWRELAPLIDDAVRGSPLFDRVLSVVTTSCHGVQVVGELGQHRWDSRGFYRDIEVRDEFARLGAELLALLDRGGSVDQSAWSPGRFGRLPGPRLRDGLVEVATAVAVLCDGELRAI